jgi:hypothetical protein
LNGNAGLHDGVQTILPVADATFMVKLDGFAGQSPLATPFSRKFPDRPPARSRPWLSRAAL